MTTKGDESMATQEVLSPEIAAAMVPKRITPMDLIDRAVEKGLPADEIAKLFDVQMRWDAEEQRKTFIIAFQTFKKNAPAIFKTKKVSYPNGDGTKTEYSHAELNKALAIIEESLEAVGITVSWESKDEPGRISMRCNLTHRDGHVHYGGWLGGPSDTSGRKGPMQAVGSSNSYLQRYTLFNVCGMAAQAQDTDGRDTSGIPEAALSDHLNKIKDSCNVTELRAAYDEAKGAANRLNDTEAIRRIVKAKDARKRELESR